MESPLFTNGQSRLIDADTLLQSQQQQRPRGESVSSYGSHHNNNNNNDNTTGSLLLSSSPVSPSFNRVKKSTWSIHKKTIPTSTLGTSIDNTTGIPSLHQRSKSDCTTVLNNAVQLGSLTTSSPITEQTSLLGRNEERKQQQQQQQSKSLLSNINFLDNNILLPFQKKQQQQQQHDNCCHHDHYHHPDEDNQDEELECEVEREKSLLLFKTKRRNSIISTITGDVNYNNTTFQQQQQQQNKTTNNTTSSTGTGATAGNQKIKKESIKSLVQYIIKILIYSLINVIIAVPALIGYTSIIFNHPIYSNYRNVLSKIVIISSLVHQIGFTLFSTIPFAIGTVQDSGLIFLSTMSTIIATTMLADDTHGIATEEEIISTSIILLSLSTASLGIILIIMGYFRLADAVSYLPMPVVGGYLAFIGYFCLLAGVALCINKNMTQLSDWQYLLEKESFILALPGLVSGLLLSLLSRYSTNDIVFPAVMILIPILFYCILYIGNISMNDARTYGWIQPISDNPVPLQDLFKLINFSIVRWDLIVDIFPTWFGMIFVVSFASCLDVAAISMDMGQPLDTNKELITVGICNTMSGLSFGYTGSYIFSQTIFTYRTGLHTRWIGTLCVIFYAYVVISPVNILEVTPLFFLGSTLIFIGFDLLYEWLVEIRERIFLSEYFIVWATFIAIQAVGMDAGILIGILVSIVDHVVHAAKTTGVYRVNKQSRAIWSPDEYKIIQDHGYSYRAPAIVALEVVGSVFFGSSFMILQRITEEIGIDMKIDTTPTEIDTKNYLQSPNRPNYFMVRSERMTKAKKESERKPRRVAAKFVVLDLTKVTNLDASAARGCFLQLAKVCQKQGIVVCACGASVRIEWMLRSHDVAYELNEEEEIKSRYSDRDPTVKSERLLLFFTIHEALQFCEHTIIRRNEQHEKSPRDIFLASLAQERRQPLSTVFARILGSSAEEINILSALDGLACHSEQTYDAGEEVFVKGSEADCFNVVVSGAVAVAIQKDDPRHGVYKNNMKILSGAGPVQQRKSSSVLMEASMHDDHEIVVASVWPVGGVFGYVDFLLSKPRNFTSVATQDGTVVATMSREQIQTIQRENPQLDGCLQRILLQASLLDLANCTCDE